MNEWDDVAANDWSEGLEEEIGPLLWSHSEGGPDRPGPETKPPKRSLLNVLGSAGVGALIFAALPVMFVSIWDFEMEVLAEPAFWLATAVFAVVGGLFVVKLPSMEGPSSRAGWTIRVGERGLRAERNGADQDVTTILWDEVTSAKLDATTISDDSGRFQTRYELEIQTGSGDVWVHQHTDHSPDAELDGGAAALDRLAKKLDEFCDSVTFSDSMKEEYRSYADHDSMDPLGQFHGPWADH